MQGTNRTISRRLNIALLLGAVFVGALIPAVSAAAAKPPPVIKSASIATFPERVHGISVAIAPDGVPWFGLQAGRLSLARWNSGKLKVETLGAEGEYTETTTTLRFDSQGALWFAESGDGAAIARRSPDGTVTKFPLPEGEPVTALTIGPGGDTVTARQGAQTNCSSPAALSRAGSARAPGGNSSGGPSAG